FLGYSIQNVDQLVCVDRHNKPTLAGPGSGFPSGCQQLRVDDLKQTGRDKVNNGSLPPGAFDSTRRQLDKLTANDLLPACAAQPTPAAPAPGAPSAPAPTSAATPAPGQDGAPAANPTNDPAHPEQSAPTATPTPQTPGENCRKAD
ncbi:MAG: serine/threonine protein phosphatase, partial [Nocardia sp.]|nr:serine/threonine protein phosphatase [Nocardia sp.]